MFARRRMSKKKEEFQEEVKAAPGERACNRQHLERCSHTPGCSS